jgi:hypothetical protein
MVAQYTFDGKPATWGADATGRGHSLVIVSSHGGALTAVAHAGGKALEFPEPCKGKAAVKTCPHVALRGPSSPDLNPGTANISYGATVQLDGGQTSKGENIVQKGYSATSSQWKLQVDGKAGRPSCVVVGNPAAGKAVAIQFVASPRSIADGAWHTLECRRAGTVLAILVDGKVEGTRTIPAGLAITNDRPLEIGGKGAFVDNDQFQGALDDVWVRVG